MCSAAVPNQGFIQPESPPNTRTSDQMVCPAPIDLSHKEPDTKPYTEDSSDQLSSRLQHSRPINKNGPSSQAESRLLPKCLKWKESHTEKSTNLQTVQVHRPKAVYSLCSAVETQVTKMIACNTKITKSTICPDKMSSYDSPTSFLEQAELEEGRHPSKHVFVPVAGDFIRSPDKCTDGDCSKMDTSSECDKSFEVLFEYTTKRDGQSSTETLPYFNEKDSSEEDYQEGNEPNHSKEPMEKLPDLHLYEGLDGGHAIPVPELVEPTVSPSLDCMDSCTFSPFSMFSKYLRTSKSCDTIPSSSIFASAENSSLSPSQVSVMGNKPVATVLPLQGKPTGVLRKGITYTKTLSLPKVVASFNKTDDFSPFPKDILTMSSTPLRQNVFCRKLPVTMMCRPVPMVIPETPVPVMKIPQLTSVLPGISDIGISCWQLAQPLSCSRTLPSDFDLAFSPISSKYISSPSSATVRPFSPLESPGDLSMCKHKLSPTAVDSPPSAVVGISHEIPTSLQGEGAFESCTLSESIYMPLDKSQIFTSSEDTNDLECSSTSDEVNQGDHVPVATKPSHSELMNLGYGLETLPSCSQRKDTQTRSSVETLSVPQLVSTLHNPELCGKATSSFPPMTHKKMLMQKYKLSVHRDNLEKDMPATVEKFDRQISRNSDSVIPVTSRGNQGKTTNRKRKKPVLIKNGAKFLPLSSKKYDRMPNQYKNRLLSPDSSKGKWKTHPKKDIFSQTSDSVPTDRPSNLDQCETFYWCHVCEKTIRSEADANHHQISHGRHTTANLLYYYLQVYGCVTVHWRGYSDDKCVYLCGLCEQTIPYINGFKRHIQIHGSYVHCDRCDKSFEDNQKLSEHQESQCGLKPYVCSECDQRFVTRGRYLLHCHSHHVINDAFRCPYCGKSLSSRGSLTTHIRLHTGNNPYKCRLCDRSYPQNIQLKLHMKSHARLGDI